MRFFYTIVLVGILSLTIVSLAFPFVAYQEADEKSSYQVKSVEVAPIVDGILDDPAWKDVESARLKWETLENFSWEEQDDFDAKFYAVWRDCNLYLAIKFKDDMIELNVSKSREPDRFDVYFDVENNGYKSKDYLYTIPVNENQSEQNPSNPSIVWDLHRGVCELSFNLGEIPRKGTIIGFGIFYNDVDSGVLENQIGWMPDGEVFLGNEDWLGKLIFDLAVRPSNNKIVTQWGRIKTLF